MKQRNRTRGNASRMAEIPERPSVRSLADYYQWAESIIEDWARTTTCRPVLEFRSRKGYSRRRSIAAWLPSRIADNVLLATEITERRAG